MSSIHGELTSGAHVCIIDWYLKYATDETPLLEAATTALIHAGNQPMKTQLFELGNQPMKIQSFEMNSNT